MCIVKALIQKCLHDIIIDWKLIMFIAVCMWIFSFLFARRNSEFLSKLTAAEWKKIVAEKNEEKKLKFNFCECAKINKQHGVRVDFEKWSSFYKCAMVKSRFTRKHASRVARKQETEVNMHEMLLFYTHIYSATKQKTTRRNKKHTKKFLIEF